MMSFSAIIMLVVSTGVVWGGLIVSTVLLRRHPEAPEAPFTGWQPQDHDRPSTLR